jgi:uncharacterized protein YbaR (Trm112 family)
MLSAELLAILACPACEERPPLELRGEYLVCLQCRRAYPIRDDIPVLLVEEAIPLEQVEARMPNLSAEP